MYFCTVIEGCDRAIRGYCATRRNKLIISLQPPSQVPYSLQANWNQLWRFIEDSPMVLFLW